jgi:hypothetical protein
MERAVRPSHKRELLASASTAPDRTIALLRLDEAFAGLSADELVAAANTLTYVFSHQKEWRLLWAEQVPGPGSFADTRTLRIGASEESVRDLSRTIGLKGNTSIMALRAEVSGQWSTMTRSSVTLQVEEEGSRTINLTVPSEGLLVERWQRDDVLTRRIRIRQSRDLPADPLPRWVERALKSDAVEITCPSQDTLLIPVSVSYV